MAISRVFCSWWLFVLDLKTTKRSMRGKWRKKAWDYYWREGIRIPKIEIRFCFNPIHAHQFWDILMKMYPFLCKANTKNWLSIFCHMKNQNYFSVSKFILLMFPPEFFLNQYRITYYIVYISLMTRWQGNLGSLKVKIKGALIS